MKDWAHDMERARRLQAYEEQRMIRRIVWDVWAAASIVLLAIVVLGLTRWWGG